MSCVWALNTVKIQCVPFCFLKRGKISNCDLSGKNVPNAQPFLHGQPFTSRSSAVRTDWHAVRTPRANRSKKFIIRSNGSSYAFDKTHQPFERLELSVRENSSAVQTVRAIRSRKFISRSNGSSYPFKKETVSYFDSRSKKTRRDNFKTINSPFFVK